MNSSRRGKYEDDQYKMNIDFSEREGKDISLLEGHH